MYCILVERKKETARIFGKLWNYGEEAGARERKKQKKREKQKEKIESVRP